MSTSAALLVRIDHQKKGQKTVREVCSFSTRNNLKILRIIKYNIDGWENFRLHSLEFSKKIGLWSHLSSQGWESGVWATHCAKPVRASALPTSVAITLPSGSAHFRSIIFPGPFPPAHTWAHPRRSLTKFCDLHLAGVWRRHTMKLKRIAELEVNVYLPKDSIS